MKNTNSPTHEDITCRAQEIWNGQGRPSGCDTAIWLDAERQLTAVSPEQPRHPSVETHSSPTERAGDPNPTIETKSSAEHSPEIAAPAPEPDALKTTAEFQRKTANAPRRPTHKNAPKSAPTESGKPLWDKPHSS